ncbi:MAG TPA: hypothetical protein VF789_07285 [Thermoanaerobaculia bacterium]
MTYHGATPKAFDSGAVAHHGPARRGEIMRLKTIRPMILFLFLWLVAGGAGAQFLQYTPPGGPDQESEDRREELERQIEAARYHLGPLRITPWASISDLAYVRNFFENGAESPDDVTASVGAGFRAYLRNGSKAAWSLQVLPEYTWWARQEERRQLNGTYLLGFHGFFNRLTLEVIAGREQELKIVTPDVPTPVSSRSDGGQIQAELQLTGAFSAFTTFSVEQQDNLVEDLTDPRFQELGRLDREERVLRAGLRWRPRQEWTLGLGAEISEVDFDRVRGLADRSNEGTAPIAEVRFRGNRLEAGFDLADRSLEARRGAFFVPYDRITGSAQVAVKGGRRSSTGVYASRTLAYTISPLYSYLQDERLGVFVGIGAGRRASLRVFAEGGANDYFTFSPLTPPRQEDVTSYGGSLTFPLGRFLSFQLNGVRSRFDSNLPGGDRTYTSLGTTIALGGLL